MKIYHSLVSRTFLGFARVKGGGWRFGFWLGFIEWGKNSMPGIYLRMKLSKVSKLTKVSELTWECHICGEKRPDGKISVFSKPLIINGRVCGQQNVRYCNDRPACVEGAKTFNFFKEE